MSSSSTNQASSMCTCSPQSSLVMASAALESRSAGEVLASLPRKRCAASWGGSTNLASVVTRLALLDTVCCAGVGALGRAACAESRSSEGRHMILMDNTAGKQRAHEHSMAREGIVLVEVFAAHQARLLKEPASRPPLRPCWWQRSAPTRVEAGIVDSQLRELHRSRLPPAPRTPKLDAASTRHVVSGAPQLIY